MSPTERLARIITADKMQLIQDRKGEHLPAEFWKQYTALAQKMLTATNGLIPFLHMDNSHIIVTIYELMRLAERRQNLDKGPTRELRVIDL